MNIDFLCANKNTYAENGNGKESGPQFFRGVSRGPRTPSLQKILPLPPTYRGRGVWERQKFLEGGGTSYPGDPPKKLGPRFFTITLKTIY